MLDLLGIDVFLGEYQVINYGRSIGPLLEQVVVFEEMVMTKSGMGYYQGLGGHGVVFHEIVDAGI